MFVSLHTCEYYILNLMIPYLFIWGLFLPALHYRFLFSPWSLRCFIGRSCVIKLYLWQFLEERSPVGGLLFGLLGIWLAKKQDKHFKTAPCFQGCWIWGYFVFRSQTHMWFVVVNFLSFILFSPTFHLLIVWDVVSLVVSPVVSLCGFSFLLVYLLTRI